MISVRPKWYQLIRLFKIIFIIQLITSVYFTPWFFNFQVVEQDFSHTKLYNNSKLQEAKSKRVVQYSTIKPDNTLCVTCINFISCPTKQRQRLVRLRYYTAYYTSTLHVYGLAVVTSCRGFAYSIVYGRCFTVDY